MREDTGLLDGIEALWQEELLYDYTLKVQHQEFRVHKFVLASVSDYFHAMFCGSMSESTSDSVELKEVNAELLCDLIKYIYTGDSSAVSSNEKEMLDLAVYFQMPKLIEKCQQILVSEVSVENCLDLLATFKTLSLQQGVDKVTTFIECHSVEVLEHSETIHLTPDGLGIILNDLEMSDHDLFFVIIEWICGAAVQRHQYVEELMGRVKFHRMSPEEITHIEEEMVAIKASRKRYLDAIMGHVDAHLVSAEYKTYIKELVENIDDSWKDRFERAYIYHRLPIHLKILNDLEQTKIETDKSLVAINVKQDSDGLSKFSVFQQHEVDGKKNGWKTCMPLETPQFTGTVPFVIEVNNFLITCSEFGKDQMWQVFDPRTLTWCKMASMSRPRDKFAMVQHGRHLYVLGGCIGSRSQKFLTDTVEEYSFDTGTWSATKKLPVAVKNHSACALNGCIYISGGQITTRKCSVLSDRLDCLSVLSARLDCLNVSTGTWESKATMLRPTTNHKMCVMMVEEKETMVVIDRDMRIQYYDPLSDQWSTCEFSVSKHNWLDPPEGLDTAPAEVKNLKWGPESRMFVDGNTVFFVNLEGEEAAYCEENRSFQYTESDNICVKWVVAEQKRDEIEEYNGSPFLSFYFQDLCPFMPVYLPMNVIIGPLAFPSDVLEYKPLDPCSSTCPL